MTNHDSYWEHHKNELSGIDKPASNEIVKTNPESQFVIRSVKDAGNNGFFVWDVTEVLGEPNKIMKKHFIECRDGSFIMIQCYHFWTKEETGAWLMDIFDGAQELILV